jgi:hypothetical protein
MDAGYAYAKVFRALEDRGSGGIIPTKSEQRPNSTDGSVRTSTYSEIRDEQCYYLHHPAHIPHHLDAARSMAAPAIAG